MRGCISSASVSILLNGSPTSEFNMEKGLRQEDPLPPFLFIIAAETINVLMLEAIEKNIYKPFKIRDMKISHLQFAHYAIFFRRVVYSECIKTTTSLKEF